MADPHVSSNIHHKYGLGKEKTGRQMIFMPPGMIFMIAIKLREAIQRYKRRTRERMTYEILAERTGLAKGTLNNMGSRHGYNATLATIEKICLALDVTPGFLLEIVDDPPKKKGKGKSSKSKKRKKAPK